MPIINNYRGKTKKRRKSGLWKDKIKIHKEFDILPKEIVELFTGKVRK